MGRKTVSDKKLRKEDYSILPDETLSEKLKHNKKMQRIIALPMILLIVCCVWLLPAAINGHSVEGSVAFSSLIALVGYSFIFAENPDNQITAVKVTVIVLAVLALPSLFEVKLWGITAQICYIIVVIIPNIVVRPFLKDIAELKAHPRYPFNNWRHDDSYLNRTDTQGALRYIDNSMNSGKVRSGSGEEFLTGEIKAFELPKHDHEKDFQQREQVWRQHDKSDTGYTMDNLKNMYLGKEEEGELSDSELEHELMKATAPSKAPEPLPEEFFQQAPVIWRTQKDGTTVMERRAVGSKPSGETESRSVLP